MGQATKKRVRSQELLTLTDFQRACCELVTEIKSHERTNEEESHKEDSDLADKQQS